MFGEGADLRDAFQESLNCAIAHGLRPSRWIGLGDKTFTAIESIAEEHPDATAGHIAGAYDAFARELKLAGAAIQLESVPIASAADRAPNLSEDQEHDADDEQNPADRGDDGGYGQ